jgi:alanine racemase
VTRYRPTVVEIDLDAVAGNVRLLRPAGAELMAVVKAHGYGHGVNPGVSRPPATGPQ